MDLFRGLSAFLIITYAAASVGDAAAGPNAPQELSAQQLASAVVSAKSPAERETALIRVMHALSVGVYKDNGSPIVKGFERGSKDFYLYEFEVNGINGAMAARMNWTVDDVAQLFNSVGVTVNGLPVNASEVYRSILAGDVWSRQHPDAAESLLPALVRELGKIHKPSYDLSKSPPINALKFDALQTTLIVTATLVPMAHEDRQADTSPRFVAFASSASQPILIGDSPCAFDGERNAAWKAFWYGGSFVEGKDLLKAVSPILDVLHAIIAGIPIEVEYVSSRRLTTHWGPPTASHESNLGTPGSKMVFQLRVWNNARYSKETLQAYIECGALFGVKFPKPGVVPDVPVHWNSGIPEAKNPGHGFIALSNEGDLAYYNETDDHGVSQLEFTPAIERIPGIGSLKVADGFLKPSVDILSAFGNNCVVR